MTRKHFRAIAASIAKIENTAERLAQAERMAEICRGANPRFDRSRFFKACNVIEQ